MENLKKLIKILQDLIDINYYGKIEISFENGKIIYIRKNETIKL
jgi:hypothetical protein